MRIEVSNQPGGIRAQVAQYYWIESMPALEEKLGQFPKGTQFTLRVYVDDADGIAVRIRKIAAARGLTIVSPGGK
jgi:hypothetical protein